jgi:hypothetical protein
VRTTLSISDVSEFRGLSLFIGSGVVLPWSVGRETLRATAKPSRVPPISNRWRSGCWRNGRASNPQRDRRGGPPRVVGNSAFRAGLLVNTGCAGRGQLRRWLLQVGKCSSNQTEQYSGAFAIQLDRLANLIGELSLVRAIRVELEDGNTAALERSPPALHWTMNGRSVRVGLNKLRNQSQRCSFRFDTRVTVHCALDVEALTCGRQSRVGPHMSQ